MVLNHSLQLVHCIQVIGLYYSGRVLEAESALSRKTDRHSVQVRSMTFFSWTPDNITDFGHLAWAWCVRL